MFYEIIKLLASVICKILFRLKVEGVKHIPKKGGFILASNHISYLDPITLGVACPRRLNFMAKEELFCNSLFSRFISMLGAFPVKRDSADLFALKEAMRRVRENKALVLFPEGSRKSDSNSDGLYSGVGFLAVKLAVPVLPAFIKGTDSVLPIGAKFIRPCKISVYFGKPIFIERRLPYQDIATQIMEDIRQLS